MRPGQQNKRGRGRNNNNNNNRRQSNPLSRSYDSTGPDVKVRGTAQNVAEKYMTLARDAQSSGDRVMAENYLQHAEHYNRIIAIGQAQIAERQQREEAAREQQEQQRAAEAANDTEADASEAQANSDTPNGDVGTFAGEEERAPRRSPNRRRNGQRQRRPRNADVEASTDDASAETEPVAEPPLVEVTEPVADVASPDEAPTAAE